MTSLRKELVSSKTNEEQSSQKFTKNEPSSEPTFGNNISIELYFVPLSLCRSRFGRRCLGLCCSATLPIWNKHQLWNLERQNQKNGQFSKLPLKCKKFIRLTTTPSTNPSVFSGKKSPKLQKLTPSPILSPK